ncbi:MAG TPA: alpha/beta hydrolase [Sphingobium sp.]
MTIDFDDFAHGRASVDAGLLHYRLGGEGEPVVLLHGWPQHSLQWHAVAPLLAERYQVLCPDLPGCGGSSIPKCGFDKRTVATSVRQLVDNLGWKSVRLVGYDHGAGVAYQYAALDQQAVSHLSIVEYVLAGCGYENFLAPSQGSGTEGNWQLAMFTVPDVAEFAFRGRERELLTWFFWHASFNPAAIRADHLQEYVDQIAKPGALRAGIEYYAAIWQDLEANTAAMKTRLKMPVQGIGGRHCIGEMVGTLLEPVAENVTGAVVERAGHWIADEDPQALADLLLEFFSRAP